MPGLEVSGAFFLASLILGIAPGPDNIFVLTQSALFGARAGLVTTLGLVSGLCFNTLAVALGIAVIFLTSPLAFNILKYAGAAYLCWLAWHAFRAAAQTDRGGSNHFPGYGALYKRGVIMNLTNPKVSIFFLAFLPQFCDPQRGNVGLQTVYFGLLFMLATILVFGCVAILGGRLAPIFNKSPKSQLFINRVAGCVFLGLALFLVFTGK